MTTFFVLTVLLAIVSVGMILLILVQRAQGGGLAGAFGGAGGAGTDTVFGGRVGDALTWATVVAFAVYLTLAVVVNRVDISGETAAAQPAQIDGVETDGATETGTTGTDDGLGATDGAEDSGTFTMPIDLGTEDGAEPTDEESTVPDGG